MLSLTQAYISSNKARMTETVQLTETVSMWVFMYACLHIVVDVEQTNLRAFRLRLHKERRNSACKCVKATKTRSETLSNKQLKLCRCELNSAFPPCSVPPKRGWTVNFCILLFMSVCYTHSVLLFLFTSSVSAWASREVDGSSSSDMLVNVRSFSWVTGDQTVSYKT